jgi:hypothetical protein
VFRLRTLLFVLLGSISKIPIPQKMKKFDWPLILLIGLTALGVLIVLGMLIAIPLFFLT